MPLDLIVVDGGTVADVRFLRHLEELSGELGPPFLVLTGVDEVAGLPSPLRPGSLSLRLSRPGLAEDPDHVRVEVRRVNGTEVHALELVASSRWPWAAAPPVPERP